MIQALALTLALTQPCALVHPTCWPDWTSGCDQSQACLQALHACVECARQSATRTESDRRCGEVPRPPSNHPQAWHMVASGPHACPEGHVPEVSGCQTAWFLLGLWTETSRGRTHQETVGNPWIDHHLSRCSKPEAGHE